MLNNFLNWLYYLGCKSKIVKDRHETELAVWQFNIFTR
jgi:hypothetical protein